MSVYERACKNKRENKIRLVLFSSKQTYKLGVIQNVFTNKYTLTIVNYLSI